MLNTLIVAYPHHIIHYRVHKEPLLFPVLYKTNLNIIYDARKLSDIRPINMVRFSAVRTGRLYPSGNIPGTHFCYRLSRPHGYNPAGRIKSVKNSHDTLQLVHPRCVWIQCQISRDIRRVRQNTTFYYDVMCHRTDNMFRPFTIRPSSGLTSRAKEEIVKL